MRDWIDKLSFRARVAIIILTWAAVVFAIAEIDLAALGQIVFEKAASAAPPTGALF
jgi:hypothetical protein